MKNIKKEEYKKYIIIKKIPGLKEMGTLLGEEEIDLFINDPKKVNNIIKKDLTPKKSKKEKPQKNKYNYLLLIIRLK